MGVMWVANGKGNSTTRRPVVGERASAAIVGAAELAAVAARRERYGVWLALALALARCTFRARLARSAAGYAGVEPREACEL
jgi:hypothetical protein